MSDLSDRDVALGALGLMMGSDSAPSSDVVRDQGRPSRGRDPLVEEMRGPDDAASNESPDSEVAGDPAGYDTPGEVLDKLREARQQAGKAGYELGKTREKLAEKDQKISQLEARLIALETAGSAAPRQQTNVDRIPMLKGEALDQFMSRIDESWEERRDDPYMQQAASYAASIAIEAVRTLRQEMQGVMGGVQSMAFNQRLEKLGIDRGQFDAVWQDPAYAWGVNLSDDDRLAALETQAGRLGAMPSRMPQPQAMSPASAEGARPTSRARPMIENSQANSGMAQNPIRLKQLALEEALEKGDMRAARKAALPIFDQWING